MKCYLFLILSFLTFLAEPAAVGHISDDVTKVIPKSSQEHVLMSQRATKSSLVLQQDAIQPASDGTGQGATNEPGQVKSLTYDLGPCFCLLLSDNANFINFCANTGQDLTNGEQNPGGSCNGIPMVCDWLVCRQLLISRAKFRGRTKWFPQ